MAEHWSRNSLCSVEPKWCISCMEEPSTHSYHQTNKSILHLPFHFLTANFILSSIYWLIFYVFSYLQNCYIKLSNHLLFKICLLHEPWIKPSSPENVNICQHHFSQIFSSCNFLHLPSLFSMNILQCLVLKNPYSMCYI